MKLDIPAQLLETPQTSGKYFVNVGFIGADYYSNKTGKYTLSVEEEVKSYRMIPKITERYARHTETIAREAEKAGHN